MEYLDKDGRIHRVTTNRDGLTDDVVVESDRLKCSKCGWKTSALVNSAWPSPRICLCGGRLVRVG